MRIRVADARSDGAVLADLARRCPMRGAITVASVYGDRAESWEPFVAPRTLLIAERDGVPIGTLSVGERYSRVAGSRVRWSYPTDFMVLPHQRDTAQAAGLLVLEARQREIAAGSGFMGFLTLGRKSPTQLARPRVARRAAIRLTCWHTSREPKIFSALPARTACEADLPAVWTLLSEFWRTRFLAPDDDFEEFAVDFARDPSLSLNDAVVVERGGIIVGFGALWDQRPLRQEIVVHRSFGLIVIRAALRVYGLLRRSARLPESGVALPLGWIRHFAACDNDAAVAVRNELLRRARARGLTIVGLALDEKDPLSQIDRGYPHINIANTFWIARFGAADSLPLSTDQPVWVDYSVS